MRWSDVRKAYPNRWLVVEALEAHSEENHRFLDRIAVIETCTDGAAAMQCYNQLHRQNPNASSTSSIPVERCSRSWRANR